MVAENRQWVSYTMRVPSTDGRSGLNARMGENGKGGTTHCGCQLMVMSRQCGDTKSTITSRECWTGIRVCWCDGQVETWIPRSDRSKALQQIHGWWSDVLLCGGSKKSLTQYWFWDDSFAFYFSYLIQHPFLVRKPPFPLWIHWRWNHRRHPQLWRDVCRRIARWLHTVNRYHHLHCRSLSKTRSARAFDTKKLSNVILVTTITNKSNINYNFLMSIGIKLRFLRR